MEPPSKHNEKASFTRIWDPTRPENDLLSVGAQQPLVMAEDAERRRPVGVAVCVPVCGAPWDAMLWIALTAMKSSTWKGSGKDAAGKMGTVSTIPASKCVMKLGRKAEKLPVAVIAAVGVVEAEVSRVIERGTAQLSGKAAFVANTVRSARLPPPQEVNCLGFKGLQERTSFSWPLSVSEEPAAAVRALTPARDAERMPEVVDAAVGDVVDGAAPVMEQALEAIEEAVFMETTPLGSAMPDLALGVNAGATMSRKTNVFTIEAVMKPLLGLLVVPLFMPSNPQKKAEIKVAIRRALRPVRGMVVRGHHATILILLRFMDHGTGSTRAPSPRPPGK